MSYLSEASGSQKVGFFIAVVIAGLMARFFWAGGIEEYFNPSKQVENQIVEVLEARPGDLAVLRAMEQSFPLQYDELLEAMTDAGMQNAPPEMVIEAGSRQLGQFMASHRNDFAAAPLPSLDAVAGKERELLASLQRDEPVYCADYLFGTLIPSDPLSQESSRLIGETAAARVQAMAAGRADQQLRLDITPAILDGLADTMKDEGASAQQLAVIFGDADSATLSAEQQCDSALRMLSSIESQTDTRRALLIGKMLAR
ncbi:hypothetical protein GRI43_07795 [Altererythrobacter luteolus]|uniref:Uncharacterized protein n=1 Tax=Pontixanthobacter luteolus TaxID=295089 RepID=A0A6I4V049_9SPHN|nr:hypothetical protein [Pontixanthobacter luteolus]MXP47293.1 hypothetical protein [Pontixanthobacter luteolus]